MMETDPITWNGNLQVDNDFGTRLVPQAAEPRLDYRDLKLERVLVMRLDNIGSVLLLAPALRALREALPEARLTLMASPVGAQAAPLLPWIDDLIVSQALWQDPYGRVKFNPERELGLIEQMRSHEFSAAFISTSYQQSPLPAAYACFLADIPQRLGFSAESVAGALSHSLPSPAEETHLAERNLSLLEALNIPVHDRHLSLSIPAGAHRMAGELLASAGIHAAQPYILVAPGASNPARRYDARRFAAVVRMLSAQAGLPLVIVGSQDEARAIEPVVRSAGEAPARNVHSLVGRTSVPELAALVERSSLVLANNAAPMHLAEAFRRPMVIMYSGSELVSQWRPRRARARLLCRPVHCSPCQGLECPYHMECLDIRPDEVAVAALELLAERFFFRLPVQRRGAVL